MNKIEMEDELRPEYDLKSLQVRKVGPGRKKFGDRVRLDPDVIEALRSLIDIAKRSTHLTQRTG